MCVVNPNLDSSTDSSTHQAVAAMAAVCMELAPTEVREITKEYSDVINAPHLGVEGNNTYGTLQTNIAEAIAYGSGARNN